MGSKKMILVLIAVAVVAVAIGLVYKQKPNREPQNPAPSLDSAAVDILGTEKEGVKKATVSSEAGLSYQQVVEKFKDLRIQLNDQCQATPSAVTFKTGTRVMFDNRGAKSHTISLDGQAYVISTYGFIVLPLSSASLPHSIKMDCDQQYNIAQILIQK